MRFSNADMAKMISCYGAVNHNSRAAAILYQQRYPDSAIFPREDEFRTLYKRLETTGSFYPAKPKGPTATVCTEEKLKEVLASIREDPNLSITKLAHLHQVSKSSIQRMLKKQVKPL